jgi:hypothetical protein
VHIGDKVRVHPYGSEMLAAMGTVMDLAEFAGNWRSITVLFEEMPSFAVARSLDLVAAPGGVLFIAIREEQYYEDGNPWEVPFGRGYYEIEEVGVEDPGPSKKQ